METVPKREKKEKKPKKIIRTAAGETWEDPSLEEWEKGNGLKLPLYGHLLNKYIHKSVRRVVSIACLDTDILKLLGCWESY